MLLRRLSMRPPCPYPSRASIHSPATASFLGLSGCRSCPTAGIHDRLIVEIGLAVAATGYDDNRLQGNEGSKADRSSCIDRRSPWPRMPLLKTRPLSSKTLPSCNLIWRRSTKTFTRIPNCRCRKIARRELPPKCLGRPAMRSPPGSARRVWSACCETATGLPLCCERTWMLCPLPRTPGFLMPAKCQPPMPKATPFRSAICAATTCM